MSVRDDKAPPEAAPAARPPEMVLPKSAEARRKLDKDVRRAGRSFWKQPLAVIGMVVLALWLLIGIFAPLIAPASPVSQEFGRFLPPSSENWMGTDGLGRDWFSRIVFGVRITVPYSLSIVIVAVAVGAVLGAVAGYAGGKVDEAIMRFTDIFFALPSIVTAMVVAAAMGPGLNNAVIAIVIVAWPPTSRIVRSLVLSYKNRNFVAAHRLLGASSTRLLAVDFRPNVVGTIAVVFMLEVAQRILLLSALSFLGLGAQPPQPEWGQMVAEGAAILDRWWIATFPGIAILSVVIAFNLIGDTLRDIVDPQVAKQMEA